MSSGTTKKRGGDKPRSGGPPAKRLKKRDDDPLLLYNTDIWVKNILPFIGPGHFIFVAGVNKRMKKLYKIFFDSIKEPPIVYPDSAGDERKAVASNTFYRAVFTSLSCAKLWNELADRKKRSMEFECWTAAKHGNLLVLKWAHKDRGFAFDLYSPNITSIVQAAAKGGHLEVLKYAHENGCPLERNASFAAAKNGRMEVLQYLHENGCPWDTGTCYGAAEGGHLNVLKYAHENGCPWGDETCTVAAENGHLEVLQYAHESGSPWNEKKMFYSCSIR